MGSPKPLECCSFSNIGGPNHRSVVHLRYGKPKTIGVLLIFKHRKPKPLECCSFSNRGGENHWSVAHFQTGEANTIGVLLIFKQGRRKPLECCSFFTRSAVLLKRNATFPTPGGRPGSSAWLGCRRSQKSKQTLSEQAFSTKHL